MSVSDTTLLVRHLPSELDDQEKIDFLCHFGAQSVRPMGTRGPMKHTAFAKFPSAEAAERCLKRLHQVEVLGCRLVVEYANLAQEKHFPSDSAGAKTKPSDEESFKKNDKVDEHNEVTKSNQDSIDEVYKRHNIAFPKKPTLFYMYPPPTVSTLTNIANALASHPKFYTQVLHLMNKMNLPCPFGTVTPSPPLALDNPQKGAVSKAVKRNLPDSTVSDDIEEIEMEYESTEESEIDSDSEQKRKGVLSEHIPARKKTKNPRKRLKVVQPDMSMFIKPAVVQDPKDVFEAQTNLKQGHIQIKLPNTDSLKQVPHLADKEMSSEVNNAPEQATEALQVVEGGFGKVEPPAKPKLETEVQKPDVNYKINPSSFLSRRKVADGRLKEDQMKDFSVFKNYVAGEPTSRLYIKNLTKQATEQDLVNLFGSFIDWDQELAFDAFDVRVMKEGRMKGQAFVSLPSEDDAKKIVKECNGFILNNKPVVIQFARSAKAKQVDKPVEN